MDDSQLKSWTWWKPHLKKLDECRTTLLFMTVQSGQWPWSAFARLRGLTLITERDVFTWTTPGSFVVRIAIGMTLKLLASSLRFADWLTALAFRLSWPCICGGVPTPSQRSKILPILPGRN